MQEGTAYSRVAPHCLLTCSPHHQGTRNQHMRGGSLVGDLMQDSKG